MPSKVACGKNTALSLKESILLGEESGDEVGVLFQCDVGGDGGGVPGVPVFLFIVVANVCDIEIGCVLPVVDVCPDVDVAN